MNQKSWTFTPDEFAYVWSAETGLGGDYPHPVNLIESPRTTDEYDRLQVELAVRYALRGDPDLTHSLQVLANPDVRIVCNGWSHVTEQRVRSCAVARGEFGVVLRQKPGPAAEFGGDLTVVVAHRRHLGRHLAATMPTASPGAAGRLRGYTPRVRGEEPPSSWLRDDTGGRTAEERIRDLLYAPRGLDGYLRIEQGIGEPRPFPPEFFNWIDVRSPDPVAGRYLITVVNDDTIVSPASPELVARIVSQRAGLV